jgi:hypothetical protein
VTSPQRRPSGHPQHPHTPTTSYATITSYCQITAQTCSTLACTSSPQIPWQYKDGPPAKSPHPAGINLWPVCASCVKRVCLQSTHGGLHEARSSASDSRCQALGKAKKDCGRPPPSIPPSGESSSNGQTLPCFFLFVNPDRIGNVFISPGDARPVSARC